ncbi:MAG: RES domain-containing protein [Bacteroidetes bacterium]|jgi:RES domain-containing protein|nr:RES domain-containing protein [Bacteroidota bacterium]
MLVYRICKKEYIHDLSGTGAALHGGRWNPGGINLLYAAGTIALAYVEFLVHNYHILANMNVCLATIKIMPGRSLQELDTKDFPADWAEDVNFTRTTQDIGKNFVKNQQDYVLKVPSAIVPGEHNFLLNPFHPLHAKTRVQHVIDPLKYDKRLVSDV